MHCPASKCILLVGQHVIPNVSSSSALLDEGSALTSTFVLSTNSWEDDVEDLPLTYLFAYVSGSANESDVSNEIIIRPALESATVSDVYLPQASTETLAWEL